MNIATNSVLTELLFTLVATRLTHAALLGAAVAGLLGCGPKIDRARNEYREATLVFVASYNESEKGYLISEIIKVAKDAPVEIAVGKFVAMPSPDRVSPNPRLVVVAKQNENTGFGPFMPRIEYYIKSGYISAYQMTLAEYKQQAPSWEK